MGLYDRSIISFSGLVLPRTNEGRLVGSALEEKNEGWKRKRKRKAARRWIREMYISGALLFIYHQPYHSNPLKRGCVNAGRTVRTACTHTRRYFHRYRIVSVRFVRTYHLSSIVYRLPSERFKRRVPWAWKWTCRVRSVYGCMRSQYRFLRFFLICLDYWDRYLVASVDGSYICMLVHTPIPCPSLSSTCA